MRIARTLTLLTLVTGIATWFATRAAMRRRDDQQKDEIDDRTRWETDGGATTAGPQPPGATLAQ
jgi:hypothetical protein